MTSHPSTSQLQTSPNKHCFYNGALILQLISTSFITNNYQSYHNYHSYYCSCIPYYTMINTKAIKRTIHTERKQSLRIAILGTAIDGAPSLLSVCVSSDGGIGDIPSWLRSIIVLLYMVWGEYNEWVRNLGFVCGRKVLWLMDIYIVVQYLYCWGWDYTVDRWWYGDAVCYFCISPNWTVDLMVMGYKIHPWILRWSFSYVKRVYRWACRIW